MQMLAIDLAKQSFHVHGINSDGEVISRRVGRQGLPALVKKLDPEVVAIEACATAHYWARRFITEGRQVRLINPHFVKPFVWGSKNDAVDAEALGHNASVPWRNIFLVALKSRDHPTEPQRMAINSLPR